MASTNDITGDVIRSGVYSADGRSNYDRIFAKKTPDEWLQTDEFAGIKILDADGWDREVPGSFEDRISYKEFCTRLSSSTCIFPPEYFNDLVNGKS